MEQQRALKLALCSSRLSQYEVLTRHTLCTAPFQGLMDTYLWIPEEHPEQQYISIKEKAQVTNWAWVLAAVRPLHPLQPTFSAFPASTFRAGSKRNHQPRCPPPGPRQSQLPSPPQPPRSPLYQRSAQPAAGAAHRSGPEVTSCQPGALEGAAGCQVAPGRLQRRQQAAQQHDVRPAVHVRGGRALNRRL